MGVKKESEYRRLGNIKTSQKIHGWNHTTKASYESSFRGLFTIGYEWNISQVGMPNLITLAQTSKP
jgi:hypothetical protein